MPSANCSRCIIQYLVNNCKYERHVYDHNVSMTGATSPFTSQAQCDLFAFQQAQRLDVDYGQDVQVIEALFCQDAPDPVPVPLSC